MLAGFSFSPLSSCLRSRPAGFQLHGGGYSPTLRWGCCCKTLEPIFRLQDGYPPLCTENRTAVQQTCDARHGFPVLINLRRSNHSHFATAEISLRLGLQE